MIHVSYLGKYGMEKSYVQGTEFKAEWDQRSWAEEEKRGLGEPVANSSSSSQGEIKSGLSAQCWGPQKNS